MAANPKPQDLWICLLRAVNVGGRNKVPMATLREALTAAGFTGVRTYLQSGNVVVASKKRSADAVAKAVHTVVRDEFDVDQPVVVRQLADVEAVLAANPFPKAAKDRPKILHVVFLADTPPASGVKALMAEKGAKGHLELLGRELVVDHGESVHTSRWTSTLLEKRLTVAGTARNWRTVQALVGLAEDETDKPSAT